MSGRSLALSGATHQFTLSGRFLAREEQRSTDVIVFGEGLFPVKPDNRLGKRSRMNTPRRDRRLLRELHALAKG